MALVDKQQLIDLAESIVPASPDGASLEQMQARNQSVINLEKMTTKIMEYIVSNLEIKGVKVDTGSLLPVTPTVTPMDGGLALHTSTNLPNINSQTLEQNNDGNDLVL